MEFSFNRPKNPGMGASGPSSQPEAQVDSANERLKKAIERNRAKQLKKKARMESPQAAVQARPHSVKAGGVGVGVQAPPIPPKEVPGTGSPQKTVGPSTVKSGPSLAERIAAKKEQMKSSASKVPSMSDGPSLSERLKAKKEASLSSARKWGDLKPDTGATPRPVAEVSVSRKSVARPENVELVGELKKKKEAPAPVAYTKPATKSVRAKRKVKTKKDVQKTFQEKLNTFAVKGGWTFCLFLFGRLIFSSGGIMDFYSSKSLLEDKQAELAMIRKENIELGQEIEKIKTNKRYQKKIVRDNLGFISKDEFLILFPKESYHSSI